MVATSFMDLTFVMVLKANQKESRNPFWGGTPSYSFPRNPTAAKWIRPVAWGPLVPSHAYAPGSSRLERPTEHRLLIHIAQAMGQNPVSPVNLPIPTKIGSKMGGEFTYPPKW